MFKFGQLYFIFYRTYSIRTCATNSSKVFRKITNSLKKKSFDFPNIDRFYYSSSPCEHSASYSLRRLIKYHAIFDRAIKSRNSRKTTARPTLHFTRLQYCKCWTLRAGCVPGFSLRCAPALNLLCYIILGHRSNNPYVYNIVER